MEDLDLAVLHLDLFQLYFIDKILNTIGSIIKRSLGIKCEKWMMRFTKVFLHIGCVITMCQYCLLLKKVCISEYWTLSWLHLLQKKAKSWR